MHATRRSFLASVGAFTEAMALAPAGRSVWL